MTSTNLTAIAATVAVALAVLAPAAVQAKATTTGKHTVTAETYVFTRPAKGWTGTMFRGETVKVERLSRSGKWAYGMAYGHVNRHVWIDARLLRKK